MIHRTPDGSGICEALGVDPAKTVAIRLTFRAGSLGKAIVVQRFWDETTQEIATQLRRFDILETPQGGVVPTTEIKHYNVGEGP